MRDAFAPCDPKGMCLLVLTLDRYGTYSGEQKWENAQEAYKDLSRLSNDFLKRLRKWFKKNGWNALGNRWVATVEAHRSGWPHVNFLLWSPQLADWLSEEKNAKMREGMCEQEANRVSSFLADIVTGAGWGLISTAERARNADLACGYIVKVAGKADESIGELSKMSQLPTNAPIRFRRIRSGKGFLPPRKKSEFMTGTLIRRQNSNDGTRDAIPLHEITDEKMAAISESCCIHEEKIWIAELEAMQRCKRQVAQWGVKAVEIPPVTRWVRYQRLDTTGPPSHDERKDRTIPPPIYRCADVHGKPSEGPIRAVA